MTCKCNPRKHGEMYMPAKNAVCCIYCREPIEGQVQCKCGKIVIPGEVHNCNVEFRDWQKNWQAENKNATLYEAQLDAYLAGREAERLSYNKGKD